VDITVDLDKPKAVTTVIGRARGSLNVTAADGWPNTAKIVNVGTSKSEESYTQQVRIELVHTPAE
jgi:hypothetical protein